METGCRHVAPTDTPFIARMRFHQSWYRGQVLQLPPGPNPSAHGELYGNMLREADGREGWNFVTKAVQWYAEQRLAADPARCEPTRLRNNLLSSQPLCFNLFAPLALDPKLATRLIRTLPGLAHVAGVTDVKLEFGPPPTTGYPDDGTAFDAWVEYQRADHTYGFVGIETKLTEPFSQKHYVFDEHYRHWQAEPAWWWRKGAEARFSTKLYNQLWRNHLLAFALLHQHNPKYAEGYTAVVHLRSDKHCAGALKAYRQLLLPRGRATLLDWPLDQLHAAWAPAATAEAERQWLNELHTRYLDLRASEPAWRAFTAEATPQAPSGQPAG